MLKNVPDYISEFLYAEDYRSTHQRGLSEIGKFYIDPSFQGQGVSDLLFQTACELSEELLMQPGLSVASTSAKAVRFYNRHGMHKVGSFNGYHGINHVFVQGDGVQQGDCRRLEHAN